MNVPAYPDVINARTACMQCDITCLRYARTYPWLPNKGVADLCLYINYSASVNACAYWYVLRFSHHVAI